MLELIRKIREQTGAGVIDIKKALDEAKGDEAEAIKVLRKRGLEKADKKGGRETKEGLIVSYVHNNGKVAALVKLLCETDFVARNEQFIEFAKDLAMQVAAMNPLAVSPEAINEKLVMEQKELWLDDLKKEDKPDEIKQKIIAGKEEKFRKENSLLGQAFVKDSERTVEEVLKEKVATIGENIIIDSFTRMEL
ncbi:MAG TPA: elongation factor Ts [Candidatus Moranbacteria bacterium]|nr:elongation factor Ts [Candidatus Moranbacteria bacterium]